MPPDKRSGSESLGSEQEPGSAVIDGAGSTATKLFTLRSTNICQRYRIINHSGPVVFDITPECEIETPKVDLLPSNPSLLVDLRSADVWKIHLVGTIRLVGARKGHNASR